jgi:hypothetical protein
MNIDAFAALTKSEIDAFVATWKAQHARGDEMVEKTVTYREAYPLDMPEGEWFEQLVESLTNNDGDVINHGTTSGDSLR